MPDEPTGVPGTSSVMDAFWKLSARTFPLIVAGSPPIRTSVPVITSWTPIWWSMRVTMSQNGFV